MKIYKKMRVDNFNALIVIIAMMIFFMMRCMEFSPSNIDVVFYIETFQLLFLFAGLFTSVCFIKYNSLSEGKMKFWLWAALWWLVLIGRSINWGREFYPDYPHWIFRVISIMLISPIVLMLLSKELRVEIKKKVSSKIFPFFLFFISLLSFGISDIVEHDRFLSELFSTDIGSKDFYEELYEIPLIYGLFMMTVYYMRIDRKLVANHKDKKHTHCS